MKDRHSTFCLLLICFAVIMSASGCGIRYMVKGQVVDAETGKPIEGATVGIHWYTYRFSPPLASGYKKIETAEDLSDANGFFQLPKHTGRYHDMGVYKSGYICWDSEIIFHPLGKTWEERGEKRKGHEVKNGMVIKLEPFKEEYPRFNHASFAVNVRRRLSINEGAMLFEEAIEAEYQFYLKHVGKKSESE